MYIHVYTCIYIYIYIINTCACRQGPEVAEPADGGAGQEQRGHAAYQGRAVIYIYIYITHMYVYIYIYTIYIYIYIYICL